MKVKAEKVKSGIFKEFRQALKRADAWPEILDLNNLNRSTVFRCISNNVEWEFDLFGHAVSDIVELVFPFDVPFLTCYGIVRNY